MIALLVAFFLYHGDAGWGWWVAWALIAIYNFIMSWEENEELPISKMY
jgi:hypothetical protein